jgi:hypothetical protein
VELLSLQNANNWESMVTENETRIAMYDEFVKQTSNRDG